MEGLKKDTRKIKYFLMKMLRTTRATTCRTFSIDDICSYETISALSKVSLLKEDKFTRLNFSRVKSLVKFSIKAKQDSNESNWLKDSKHTNITTIYKDN